MRFGAVFQKGGQKQEVAFGTSGKQVNFQQEFRLIKGGLLNDGLCSTT